MQGGELLLNGGWLFVFCWTVLTLRDGQQPGSRDQDAGPGAHGSRQGHRRGKWGADRPHCSRPVVYIRKPVTSPRKEGRRRLPLGQSRWAKQWIHGMILLDASAA